MDKKSLPRWGWLLVGLMGAAFLAELINVALGVSPEWNVVTVVALMAPLVIYIGIWQDEERQYYWEYSRGRIVSDVFFIVFTAAIGAALALALVIESGLFQNGGTFSRLIPDVLAMLSGFILGWALFWWRNPEMYRVSS